MPNPGMVGYGGGSRMHPTAFLGVPIFAKPETREGFGSGHHRTRDIGKRRRHGKHSTTLEESSVKA